MEPLGRNELKDLVRRLRRMASEGKGWPVSRVARELRVSRDFIYDRLADGLYFERLARPRPLYISAESILLYLKRTYRGTPFSDAFDGE